MRLDIKGQKFNHLTAIKSVGVKNKQRLWLFECDCKNKTRKILTCSTVKCGNTKSCGCMKFVQGKNSKIWKGHGDISGRFLDGVKRSAQRRNIKFDISIEDIWNQYIKQNKRCALSKVKIYFTHNNKKNTASIDRIDNNKPYTKKNIQIVHQIINIMKWKSSQKEFINWCKLVVKNN